MPEDETEPEAQVADDTAKEEEKEEDTEDSEDSDEEED